MTSRRFPAVQEAVARDPIHEEEARRIVAKKIRPEASPNIAPVVEEAEIGPRAI